jgi:hypothetical protein
MTGSARRSCQIESRVGGGARRFCGARIHHTSAAGQSPVARPRNFGLGTLGNFLLGFALYASAYLLPQYLAVTQGFDSDQAGEVIAWTGPPQLVLIPLVPFLMRRLDARLLVGTGLLIFAIRSVAL